MRISSQKFNGKLENIKFYENTKEYGNNRKTMILMIFNMLEQMTAITIELC